MRSRTTRGLPGFIDPGQVTTPLGAESDVGRQRSACISQHRAIQLTGLALVTALPADGGVRRSLTDSDARPQLPGRPWRGLYLQLSG